MTSGYLPHSAGDLVAELAAEAPQIGANTGLSPCLTIYRFTAPVGRENRPEQFLVGLLDAASGNGSAQAS